MKYVKENNIKEAYWLKIIKISINGKIVETTESLNHQPFL